MLYPCISRIRLQDYLVSLLRHYEKHGMLEACDRDLVVFADTVEELTSHLK